MAKINLDKLLSANPSVAQVKQALEQVFHTVDVERRHELFFNFQLTCLDESYTPKLIVRYGWSDRKSCWMFEPIKCTR